MKSSLKSLVPLVLLIVPQWGVLVHAQSANISRTFRQYLERGQIDADLEREDNALVLLKAYDFIVVGAGTAGCTMAARLSENPKWQVLLVEAGDAESLVMDIPFLAHFLQLGEMNWKYSTQPTNDACLAMEHNRCLWPRGKVMGGSSVLNYMIYTRGNRRDYDRWASLGNVGWSYNDVLPYFRKLEGSSVPDAEAAYVGRKGPVKISYVKWRTPIADAFVAAAQQNGLQYLDYNGRLQTGVSYLQTTIGAKSVRWSANRAYLYPLKGKRSNLHIAKNTLVTKLLIDASTKAAAGLLLSSGGQTFKVAARKEIVLSAGAINTPQLLMLSGIGPAKHLRSVGIKPLVELAVGYNLHDHTAPLLQFSTNATSLHYIDMYNAKSYEEYMQHGGGMFAVPGSCEAIAFWDLAHPARKDGWPDVELLLASAVLSENPLLQRAFGLRADIINAIYGDLGHNAANGFIIFPIILRPKSRGRIKLQSADAHKYPLIYANYFARRYDMDISVRAIEKALQFIEEPAMRQINAKLWHKTLPPCRRYGHRTRAYWECYVRQFTFTLYHYAGTAKMGAANDTTAVVDARLRVYGVERLRVADASIMPELIAGHPNGAIFMIAEKAADMIKADHGYK